MMDDFKALRATLAVQQFDRGAQWAVAIEIDGRRNAVRVPDATGPLDAMQKAVPILLDWAAA